MAELKLHVSQPGFAALATPFVRAGLLDCGDVQVVDILAQAALPGGCDAQALLGLCFAVRGPRLGHVGVALAEVQARLAPVAQVDAAPPVADGDELPPQWPVAGRWLELVRALGAPLVADGTTEPGAGAAPFVVSGDLLYLHRSACAEVKLAGLLNSRAAVPLAMPPFDEPARRDRLATALDDLFGTEPTVDWQRVAAALACGGALTIITGGPGTGKTTTVARMLAALLATADGPLQIALTAPTGKAAARMTESLHDKAKEVAVAMGRPDMEQALLQLRAQTIHRLLGYQPRTPGRFRHDAANPLPHQVVVVDELSMVALPLMTQLIDAVAPAARLVLLGDPDQLASVEAGCVLGDLRLATRPPQLAYNAATLQWLAPLVPGATKLAAQDVPAGARAPAAVALAQRCAHLVKAHRFEQAASTPQEKPPKPCDIGGIATAMAKLAATNAKADVEVVVAALYAAESADFAAVQHLRGPTTSGQDGVTTAVALAIARCKPWFDAAHQPTTAASDDEMVLALKRQADFRILCAHHDGPDGVTALNLAIARGLLGDRKTVPQWYAGRPVLITANDPGVDLFNGDVGIAVRRSAAAGDFEVAFAVGKDSVRRVPVGRLPEHQTCFAMTIHKSQGSECSEVLIALREPYKGKASPLQTRELLYTALTRAKVSAILLASPDAVRTALDAQVARWSGLTRRLL